MHANTAQNLSSDQAVVFHAVTDPFMDKRHNRPLGNRSLGFQKKTQKPSPPPKKNKKWNKVKQQETET